MTTQKSSCGRFLKLRPFGGSIRVLRIGRILHTVHISSVKSSVYLSVTNSADFVVAVEDPSTYNAFTLHVKC